MGALIRNTVLATIALFASVFSPLPANAVMYGTEDTNASTNQPWVVSIWYSASTTTYGNPDFICTGTLIQPDVVLTAAHCIDDEGFLFVKSSVNTLRERSGLTEVDAVWRHPRYSGRKLVNDLGLLKLESPLTNVRTLDIAPSSLTKAITLQKNYKFSGWGIDQNQSEATFLRSANLANQDLVGKTKLTKFGFSPTTQIAAGSLLKREKVYQGICHGDSGGPLTAMLSGREFVVGVASWVVGEGNSCDKGLPSVFARVTYYANDLALAVPTLRASAITSNRAVPKLLSPITINGTPAVGKTLTCNSGAWSPNTESVSFKWVTSYGAVLANDASIVIQSAQEGSKIECVVAGANRNAVVSESQTVEILSRPQASGYLSISGLGVNAPTTGDTLGCGGVLWPNGYAVSTLWYVSDSAYFQLTKSEKVAEGAQIKLDSNTRKKLLGKWLYCFSVASGPGGSSSVSVMRLVPSPVTPVIWASASLKSTDFTNEATTYSCSAFSSYFGSNLAIEYRWGIADNINDTTYALELGQGQTIVLDRYQRAAYKNKFLVCKATGSTEDGSSVSNSFIYLPAFFNF